MSYRCYLILSGPHEMRVKGLHYGGLKDRLSISFTVDERHWRHRARGTTHLMTIHPTSIHHSSVLAPLKDLTIFLLSSSSCLS
jgi:hypothetical protein